MIEHDTPKGLSGVALATEETFVSGVTGRYAAALFDLAQERKQTDQVATALDHFATLVNLNNDMARFVRSPALSTAEQLRALDALLPRAEVDGLAAQFIKMVATKRRLFAISGMIDDFNKLNDAAKGVTRAQVTVAQPLSEAHLASLKAEIIKISGTSKVDLNVKVDPAIIGGMIVQLGSRMVDGSLRTRLTTIHQRMKEVG